ncbi:hypothetical protein [Spirochaeta lutea]|uniref:Uncharacterized protein n=1 Tax=Spirochaeta lutea TaxID=1480694 RepID=A0A098R3V1_9SPIO|nr:hypothetical protein [Spirochaeta lutea]KGE73392.1 hypothetical protein DC28_03720 [Spirochaeta lutea]
MTYTSQSFSVEQNHGNLARGFLDGLVLEDGHPGITSLDVEHWLYGGRMPRPARGQGFFRAHGALFFPGSEVEPDSRPDGMILAPGPGNEIRMVAREAAENLYAVQLGLIEGEWSRGKASLRIPVMEGREDLESFLASRGYSQGEPVRLIREVEPRELVRGLGQEAREILKGFSEDGTSLASYGEQSDTPRHVLALGRNLGYEGINGTWFEAKRRMPGYRPELDLFIIAPDGREVGNILGVFNPHTRRGEISYLGSGDLGGSGAEQAKERCMCLAAELGSRMEGIGAQRIEIPCPPEPDAYNRLFDGIEGQGVTRELVWEKVF